METLPPDTRAGSCRHVRDCLHAGIECTNPAEPCRTNEVLRYEFPLSREREDGLAQTLARSEDWSRRRNRDIPDAARCCRCSNQHASMNGAGWERHAGHCCQSPS